MKLSFKQYSALANLTEDQVSEEKLTEIFGAFFGNKSPAAKASAVADLKAKKAGLQTSIAAKQGALAKNTKALDKNKEWMNWVASQKNPSAQKKFDKIPSNQQNAAMARAAERDWVQGLANEAEVFERAEITYKGYKLSRKEGGVYHVTKGTTFVGHGKDYQEAMKVADKHREDEAS